MTDNTKRNVRIWVPHPDPDKGYFKLTLRPFKPVSITTGGPTEEGWHWESETYVWRPNDDFGGFVEVEAVSDGVDCDGRLSRYHTCVSPSDRLAWRPGYRDPHVRLPDWQRVAASQRDYAAEAMGY